MDEGGQLTSSGNRGAGLSRRSVLIATGCAAVSTALTGPGSSAAASARQAAASAPKAAAGSVIQIASLTAAITGSFRRVRAVDDDTRLNLLYPSGTGTLTGQKVAAPGFYGLDFTAYPAGPHAEQYLQDLFDNTPFGYLGFYFKTTGGHPGGSWTGKATGLLAQGWNLIPIYVGRQQGVPNTSQISGDTKTATTQGDTDGKNAVALATAEAFPLKTQLYLDIEGTLNLNGPDKGKDGPPTNSTIAYIKAWLAAVKASGKYSGALYDANSHWKVGNTTYYDSMEINSKLGAGAPITWVLWDPGAPPVGVQVGVWPLDANGDVATVAVKTYSKNPQWGFTKFAQLWQFKLDWQPIVNKLPITFLTDTGAPRALTSIAPTVDLDVSKTFDPGNTAPGRPKAQRRPATSAVMADPATVKPGKAVQITVTLDRSAPAPNGSLVLLRSSSPYLVVPSSARVTAKASSAVVQATAAEGSPAGNATVQARVLHQLAGTPANVTVQISP